MDSPRPSGRFSAYSTALKALSTRTGTPLPSLILSFGILHEITAAAPLFIVFYGARTFGIGDRVIDAITEHATSDVSSKFSSHDPVGWGKRKLTSWVEEGDRWAAKVGTRYGIFGYDKRAPGNKPDVETLTHLPGHLAGDVANAVVAYAVTKAILPLRIGLSMYLSPAFSRGVVEPFRKSLVGLFHRRK